MDVGGATLRHLTTTAKTLNILIKQLHCDPLQVGIPLSKVGYVYVPTWVRMHVLYIVLLRS
jgi:hypothetical protein